MKHFLRFVAIALAILVLGSKSEAQQVGDYGSAASGNWSDLSSWVICETNGDWSDASAAVSLPTTTDKVYIRDGHTITINQNVSIATLIVGEGASGVLTFDATTNRQIIVSGNVTVEAGGSFIVYSALKPTGDVTAASNIITNVSSTAGISALMNISGTGIPSATTVSAFDATTITISQLATITGTTVQLSVTPAIKDSIYIGGDLTNNGTFDMSLGSSTTICNVIFNDTLDNQTISGSGATTRFRGVTIAKKVIGNKVICSSNVSLSTLTYTAGTWEQTSGRLSSSGTLNIGSLTATASALNVIGSGSVKVDNSIGVYGSFLVNTTDSVIVGTGVNKIDHTFVNGSSATYTSGTVLIYGKFATSLQCVTLINGANIIVDPKGFAAVSADYGFRFTTGGGTNSFTFSSGTVTILNPNPFTGANAELNLNTTASVSGTAKFILGQGSSTVASTAGYRINCSATALLNHLTINTGTVGVSLLTNNLTVKGTLAVVSSGTLNLNTKVLSYQSGATLEYNGTSAQNTTDFELPAASGPTNITVNNTSGVTLQAARTITGALTLTNGNLALNSQTLTYGSMTGTGGTISETQSLNAPSSANVGTLGALITSGSDLGSTTVKRGFNAQTGNSNQSILRWYEITPTTNSGLDATLVFPYTEGAELNGIAEANLRLFKSTDNGTSWTMAGGTVDEGANTVTLSGIAGFSRWTLGSATAPLPVEIQSFVAKTRYGSVELIWSTATEVNNSGFEIEKNVRGSWSKIGFVEGAGTSNVLKSYSFVDAGSKGKISYRLKQIDRDGNFTYSSVVEAMGALTAEDFTLSQNYPNPFNPNTTITFAMKNTEQVRVNVYNSLGQAVATLFDGITQPNEIYSLTFDGKNLSSGIYFYSLRSASRNEVKKMLLMK